jgi:hypothetical protein
MTDSNQKITLRGLEKLPLFLNHRALAALLGAGVGTVGGALLPDRGKKKRMRRAALGGLLGAGAGYAGAVNFPSQARRLNETVMLTPLRRAVGRVVTNVVAPLGYSNKLDELKNTIKAQPMSALKSVWNDRPMAFDRGSESDKVFTVDRDVPYRQMFGLKPRAWAEPHISRPDGTLQLSARRSAELENDIKNQTYLSSPQHYYHHTLGNVNVRQENPGEVSYRDRWDFGLHANEKPDTPENLLRYWMEKFVRPPEFHGRLRAQIASENQTAQSE